LHIKNNTDQLASLLGPLDDFFHRADQEVHGFGLPLDQEAFYPGVLLVDVHQQVER